ncbi:hypothetical protein MJO29_005285 [Puccinia striiformis f. sp. tritici]|nr:hypothetical protein MJO29_005285 [Puccinia striiformis f. sp. tritici]
MNSTPNSIDHTIQSMSTVCAPASEGRPDGRESTSSTQQFNISDLTVLAKAAAEVEPTADADWSEVAKIYNRYAEEKSRQLRTDETLRLEFNAMVHGTKPTTDTNCPRHVFCAINAQATIDERYASQCLSNNSIRTGGSTQEVNHDVVQTQMEGNDVYPRTVGLSDLAFDLAPSGRPEAHLCSVQDLIAGMSALWRTSFVESCRSIDASPTKSFDPGDLTHGTANQGQQQSSSVAQAPEPMGHPQGLPASSLEDDQRAGNNAGRPQNAAGSSDPHIDQPAHEYDDEPTLLIWYRLPKPRTTVADESMGNSANGKASNEHGRKADDHHSNSHEVLDMIKAKLTIDSLRGELDRSNETQDRLRQENSRLKEQARLLGKEKATLSNALQLGLLRLSQRDGQVSQQKAQLDLLKARLNHTNASDNSPAPTRGHNSPH